MVKKGEADAMVSAGSTGANLVGGHVIIGRIKGVELRILRLHSLILVQKKKKEML